MDVDQSSPSARSDCSGHGLAVDVRRGSGRRPTTRRRMRLAVVLDGLLVEPRAQRPRCGAGRSGGDLRTLRAVPHGAAVGAAADRQQQRVDEDGLAGAGLARQRREAGPSSSSIGVDDREIADLQVREHGRVSRRPAARRAAAAPVQLGAQDAEVVVARADAAASR